MFDFQDEANNLFTHAETNSDRSVCIIMSSMLERMLETAILFRLKINDKDKSVLDKKVSLLFEENGALSSFSGNIDFAFALSLMDEDLRKDFHTVRRIRNAFAHAALTITFDTEEISNEIRKFTQLSDANTIKTDDTGAHVSVTGRVIGEWHVRFLRGWISIGQRFMENLQKQADSMAKFIELMKSINGHSKTAAT
jgi:DNA-binding MltR family transcriptional regulator